MSNFKKGFCVFTSLLLGASTLVFPGVSVYVSETIQESVKSVNDSVCQRSFVNIKAGMERLRNDLATTATLLVTDETLGAAIMAEPLGALIGLTGSTILGSRVRDESNDMKRWIDVGSSEGGGENYCN